MKKLLVLLVIALTASLVGNVVLLLEREGNKTVAQNATAQIASPSDKGDVADRKKAKETTVNEKQSTPPKGNTASERPLYKGRPVGFWIKQLQDKDTSFRQEALKALGEIGPDGEEAIPSLIQALEDGQDEIRSGAVRALGQMGPKAKSAVPALLKLHNYDQRPESETFVALCKIGHYYTNDFGMKFVWIPPGTFMMGSPKEEKGRDPYEVLHKVTITKGFYMGVHPVTQEQWWRVMGDQNFTSTRFKFKGVNLPADRISWDASQEFLKQLREKEKNSKPYRLPTEAEWEYACRAGTTTPFHFGETISTEQANYDGNMTYGSGRKGECREKTTPVGSFPPNAWGLRDMHGNVWQWCQTTVPRPTGVDPEGENTQYAVDPPSKVLRGGYWGSTPTACRSAYRNFYSTSDGENVGFRVCFTPD